jgi:hypothetical protein
MIVSEKNHSFQHKSRLTVNRHVSLSSTRRQNQIQLRERFSPSPKDLGRGRDHNVDHIISPTCDTHARRHNIVRCTQPLGTRNVPAITSRDLPVSSLMSPYPLFTVQDIPKRGKQCLIVNPLDNAAFLTQSSGLFDALQPDHCLKSLQCRPPCDNIF